MQPNNTANNTSPAPAPMTTPMNPGGDIVFKDKPKKKTGLIIGILFLVLLAAGGIGFGIWAYLDGNQKTSDLNNQISDLQNQLANQPEKEEIIINENTESDINPADYIYIGEWGIKIKIPSELNVTGYIYEKSGSSYGDGIALAGVKGNVNNIPEFAKIDSSSSAEGYLRRIENGGEFPYGALVYTDENNNNYYYEHPQSIDSTDESMQNLEIESVNLFEQMLRDKNNYSKI